MANRTLQLILATVLLEVASGCQALGPVGGPGALGVGGSAASMLSANPVPGVLADAGDSIFRVVAWGFAVIIGALALAFAAKLLNGRQRPSPTPLPPAPVLEVKT